MLGMLNVALINLMDWFCFFVVACLCLGAFCWYECLNFLSFLSQFILLYEQFGKLVIWIFVFLYVIENVVIVDDDLKWTDRVHR